MEGEKKEEEKKEEEEERKPGKRTRLELEETSRTLVFASKLLLIMASTRDYDKTDDMLSLIQSEIEQAEEKIKRGV
jgi:hypothetical protein